MARGQAQAADTQIGLNRNAAAGYGKSAGGFQNQLSEEANKLINSQGFDPQTLGAITNAGMGAVNATYGAAGDKAARMAATSGNPASIGALEDELARGKGEAAGKEAGDIQIQNALFKAQQQKQGQDILANLFGTDVGAQTSLYGQVPGLLGGRAAGGGWTQGFKDVLSGITGHLGPGGGGGGGEGG